MAVFDPLRLVAFAVLGNSALVLWGERLLAVFRA
jgi:hypothetical protein